MRDQIIQGIINSPFTIPTENIEPLADSILAALSQNSDPTTLTHIEATDALMVTTSTIIAEAASAAINRETADRDWEAAENWDGIIPDLVIETLPVGTGHRHVRQFLFGIQGLFGVRTRISRGADDSYRIFLVAGKSAAVASFRSTWNRVLGIAEPFIADLSEDDRAEFWATLATRLSDDWNSRRSEFELDLIEGASQAATRHLHSELGPTRTLTRVPAAQNGPIADLAASVFTSAVTN